MPYRKQQFANGEIYHITTRAIDDNLIFKNINDYYRGIFSIYEFNNANPVSIFRRRKERSKEKAVRRPTSYELLFDDKRDKLAEIMAFCLMPNHIHLLVKQTNNQGINKFMVKLGSGYGRYFNQKYTRKGYVFQNRFNSVHIKNDNQLKVVFTYIHTNPISLIQPKWKEIGIADPQKVINFLEDYKWSSYQDYIGKNNFPSVTDRDFIAEVMGGVEGCRVAIDNWVKYKGEVGKYPQILIE